MTEILAWLIANAATIVTVVTAVVAAASAITRLTPNKTDDKVVAVIQQIIGFFSALQPHGGESTLKAPGTRIEAPLLEKRTELEQTEDPPTRERMDL